MSAVTMRRDVWKVHVVILLIEAVFQPHTDTACHWELFASWMRRVISAKLIGHVFNIQTERFGFYTIANRHFTG
jgi:hypothetical protein